MIGYRVLYVDEAETQPKLNVSVGANISSIELTGLLVYTNYCIQVLAFNSQQDGNASDCLFASTDGDGKTQKKPRGLLCQGSYLSREDPELSGIKMRQYCTV